MVVLTIWELRRQSTSNFMHTLDGSVSWYCYSFAHVGPNFSSLVAHKWLPMVVSDYCLENKSLNPPQTWCVHRFCESSKLFRLWVPMAPFWPYDGPKSGSLWPLSVKLFTQFTSNSVCTLIVCIFRKDLILSHDGPISALWWAKETWKCGCAFSDTLYLQQQRNIGNMSCGQGRKTKLIRETSGNFVRASRWTPWCHLTSIGIPIIKMRPSYLCNGKPHIGRTSSLYWIHPVGK